MMMNPIASSRAQVTSSSLHLKTTKKPKKVFGRLYRWISDRQHALSTRKDVVGSTLEGDSSQLTLHQDMGLCTLDLHAGDDDDVSSVSVISRDFKSSPFRRIRFRSQRKPDMDHVPSSVPFEVFVPTSQLTEESSNTGEDDNCCEDDDDNEPEPVEREAPRFLVSDTASLCHTDPEVNARIQAIQQLSSMMGPAHPDVIFSLKYLGLNLQRLGDHQGAQAIQDYIQLLQHSTMCDSP